MSKIPKKLKKKMNKKLDDSYDKIPTPKDYAFTAGAKWMWNQLNEVVGTYERLAQTKSEEEVEHRLDRMREALAKVGVLDGLD